MSVTAVSEPKSATDRAQAVWGEDKEERAAIVEHDSKIPRDWAEGFAQLDPDRPPADVPPPRSTRFGSPLVMSRVHWVRLGLISEVKFLTWTADNLLRPVVYQGLREGKPAREVRREVPHPET